MRRNHSIHLFEIDGKIKYDVRILHNDIEESQYNVNVELNDSYTFNQFGSSFIKEIV